MAILVKDMLLPKSCYECPLNTGEYSPAEYEKRYCAITDRSMCLSDYKKRPSDCPLVDLSDEHGRLIEEDEVVEAIREYARTRERIIGRQLPKGVKAVLMDVIGLVFQAPTVIEAEGSE